MAVGKRITSLRFSELVILVKVFLKHPIYLIPTYRATNKTIKTCNQLYGKLHHENNRTNAFRHALWNYLICANCVNAAASLDEATHWSKMITDLHERLSPNEGLAKAMDLHNNKIGRQLFRSNSEEKEKIVPVLQKMMTEAVKVTSLREVEEENYKLVFIEEV